MKQILIKTEDSTKDSLKLISKLEKRSLNSLINKILFDFVGGYNGKSKK